MRFRSCGKWAYVPLREAEDEAERMRVEEGYEGAHAYECPNVSRKGAVHFHVTSGGGYRGAIHREFDRRR